MQILYFALKESKNLKQGLIYKKEQVVDKEFCLLKTHTRRGASSLEFVAYLKAAPRVLQIELLLQLKDYRRMPIDL